MNVKPDNLDSPENTILKIANATLLGSLVLHVYACTRCFCYFSSITSHSYVAILSFLGAFLLVSYKLQEARREEMIVDGAAMVNSPLGDAVIRDVELDAVESALPRPLTRINTQPGLHNSVNSSTTTPQRSGTNGSNVVRSPVFSTNPHIEQVTSFTSNITSHRVLNRTHAVCIFLAAVGFVLAIIGILCYSWALAPRSVGIFTSACLGFALLTTLVLPF